MEKYDLGFTLLELMISIVILGILAAMISGNFITSLKKGRDAQRKSALEQVQKSVEMYYEDVKSFPASITFGGQLCHPSGCDTKIYMEKVPNDPNSGMNYQYCVDDLTTPTKYQLYAKLENSEDPKIITPSKQANCTADCPSCNYGIAGVDISP